MASRRKTPRAPAPTVKQREPLSRREVALFVLLQIAWIIRIVFIAFLVIQLARRKLLVTAGTSWQFIFLAVYFGITLAGLAFVRSDRPDGAEWKSSKTRVQGMIFRLALHGLTISLIALELTWDFGHQNLVTGVLSSVWAGATWAAIVTLTVLFGSKLISSKPSS